MIKMASFNVSIVLVMLTISSVLGMFSPSVTVHSCTKSKLVMNVTDAAASGIIYIQGQNAACKQTTNTGSHLHEFDFGSCGLAWEESFKIIVQKKALYQTGDDKQIPVLCIADLSDLTVDNGLQALDKDDDAGQNLTVKPTATMKLFRDGQDVGGSTVKLTDLITMSIELDSEFIQDFDLKAMTCSASTIEVINSDCAVDTELFPNFQKPIQGMLSSTFGAFRTTDLNGGSVGMTFSCTLKVCLGDCTPTVCPDGNDGWGRKKRSATLNGLQKRQAVDGPTDAFEEINVGATIRISTEEVIIEDEEEGDNDVCLDKSAFVGGIVTISIVLLVLLVSSGYLAMKKLRLKDANH